MLRKFAFLITLTAMSYTAMASNNNPPEPDQALKLTKPIETYLKETDKPKLLLGCGHNGELDPNAVIPGTAISVALPNPRTGILETYTAPGRLKYTRDCDSNLTFHAHDGWYTVDMEPEMKADVVGDLTHPTTLNYVFQPNRFKLVWHEHLPATVMTQSLFIKIAQCLEKDGAFVCPLPIRIQLNRMYILDTPKDLGQVWKKAFDTEPGDFSKERGYKVQVDYGNPEAVLSQIAPYFRHLGFSTVTVHKSHGGMNIAIRNQTCLLNETIRLLDGSIMTKGDLLINGPHPEAAAIDPFFGNVLLGDLYMIARK